MLGEVAWLLQYGITEWCVGSWDEIRILHRSMRNGSRVADELYIKRVSMALEDFLFFSLYSFSCIAKQVTTLKQLRLLSCLVLSCFQYHLRLTPLVTLERVLQYRT